MLDLLRDEAVRNRPSRDMAIARLLELVLLETLRRDEATRAESFRGLLAGIADEHLSRAVLAMHSEIAAAWTVASLAREAGMSRSAFAAHFQRTVGISPLAYLIRWRMATAAKLLNEGRQRIPDIALLCGYGSASAFSKAFTREFGRPPAAYRAAPIAP